MNNSEDTIEALIEYRPQTFEIIERSSAGVCGAVTVDSEHSLVLSRFVLRIAVRGRNVRVQEDEPGTALPEACPERHIESKGNFCLGLKSGIGLVTEDEIRDWWSLLCQYLVLQLGADRTGLWPPQFALSHGGGGAVHAKALRTAKRLGLKEDYEAHVMHQSNWITDLVSDYEVRRKRMIEKKRPVAPVDTLLLEKAVEAAAQRGSSRLTDRKRARSVRILAELELSRVKLEDEFWNWCRQSGMVCCRTMRHCPLRRDQ